MYDGRKRGLRLPTPGEGWREVDERRGVGGDVAGCQSDDSHLLQPGRVSLNNGIDEVLSITTSQCNSSFSSRGSSHSQLFLSSAKTRGWEALGPFPAMR